LFGNSAFATALPQPFPCISIIVAYLLNRLLTV